ncbi:SIS domain-containing protein [Lyngbya confervoides]|uniref:Glutamine--fructose-6-phosphate aminotransferase [isomerizing] n=1 Tax=Lyngbya confervoides BDU141951 TaxID=1574623 RepID=A0ABD4T4S2_9CYAN|nr:SIS domain-containing protein [Lyngbya confervoides]MCM1983413.1 SIS domain-containing protein [Lyngbya confervoides BDU141951]
MIIASSQGNEQQKSGYIDNILEQPQILRSLLDRYSPTSIASAIRPLWSWEHPSPILLTGMGASHSVLWPIYLNLMQQGLWVQRAETSELIHYLPQLLHRPGLCMAVSQSGESVEIQRLVAQIRDRRQRGQAAPHLLSITTTLNNTLAQASDVAFVTQAGAEVGVATKTFTSTLALLHWIGQALLNRLTTNDFAAIEAIAKSQQALLHQHQAWIAPALDPLAAVSTFALVGRGPSLAAVYDGALVLKESLRQLAHGFSGGEFRHGPMEMLSPNLGVLIFTTAGSTLELSQRLGADVALRGGHLVTIGQQGSEAGSVHLSLPPCHQGLAPLLEILPIQLIAGELARKKGIIPGEFRWGGKVVTQE